MLHKSKQYARVRAALAKAREEEAKAIEEATKSDGTEKTLPVEPETYAVLTRAGAGFDMTDLGNADRLLAKYGDRMAFVEGVGWVVFDERCWDRYSGDKRAKGMAGEIARAIKFECKHLQKDEVPFRMRWAERSGRASSVKGMLEMAEPATLTPLDAFDKEPNLWNAQNGTVDLATGRIASFSPAKMLTRG